MKYLSDLYTTTIDLHWSAQKSAEGTISRAQTVLHILGARSRISDLSSASAQKVTAALRKRGLANGTINRHLAVLSKMMSVAVEAGVLESKPRVGLHKEAEHRVRFLSREEESELLALLENEGHDYAMLALLLVETGLRVSEARALRWRDLTETEVTVRNTKGEKARAVPLTERAKLARREAWDSFYDGRGPFVCVPQSSFNHAWARVQAKMGLAEDREFVPHCLRHTCASRLVQAGVSLRVVQLWLGHSDIKTTMRYAHVRDVDLVAAAQALEPN